MLGLHAMFLGSGRQANSNEELLNHRHTHFTSKCLDLALPEDCAGFLHSLRPFSQTRCRVWTNFRRSTFPLLAK
jgi:hypothetical protein